MLNLKKILAQTENKKLRNQVYAMKDFLRSLPHPILVYQMGKVGSTSVYKSLKQAQLPALHVHKIAPPSEYSYEFYKESGKPPDIDLFVGQLLYPYLKYTWASVKVISMIREPVARYLSKLYHDTDMYSMISDDVHTTLHSIREHLEKPETFEEGMFKWFDREIDRNFNVDILSTPFDKESGYTFYRSKRSEILLVKVEYLADIIPTVVSNFVGADLVNVKTNVGSEKKSGDEYKQVKDSFYLPDSTLERIYNHKWVRHFYTQEEIDNFKDRWSS